jgi:hypothetical protein
MDKLTIKTLKQNVSHVGIFDPDLSIIAPLTISQVRLPPSLCQSTVNTDSVWLEGGWGC